MTDIDEQLLGQMDASQLAYLEWQTRWLKTARDNQMPPEDGWSECGFMAGRGFGKTRVGAEWIARDAFEDPLALPGYVIAPTQGDVRFTCFEGESGLLSIIPSECVRDYNRSDLILTLTNGAILRGFSAEKPDRLRGPQAARAWCFVAGTQVSTPFGDRAIETLRAGDLVLTRKGPRRVVANSVREADVGVVDIGGRNLVGTADHPVYLPHGWTRMDRLRVGDRACVIGALSGTASVGTATELDTTSERISPFGQSARSDCIASAGSQRSGRSQTVGMCTTETRTKATTPSKTSIACPTARTNESTRVVFRGLIGLRGLLSRASARLAASRSCASARALRLAADAANNSQLMPSALGTVCARTAATLSDLGLGLSAASVVSTWRPLGRQSVYCLQVDGEPEYFANGVLVHNCDELAAWQNAETTWDMMMFGLRLGPNPKVLWTTTPKPVPLVRSLIAPKSNRVIITGSTYDNRKNLPKTFFDNIAAYEGTKIGRQELDGELLDPEEAGIIKRSWFNLWPKDKPLPRLDFIVLSLDTAYTEATRDKKTGDADPTACTVWGVFYIKRVAHMILLDAWDEHLGLPELIRRTKREMNTAYGDDEDAALIKPLFGTNKPLTSGRKPDVLLIEDKGSGISLRQMLAEARLEAYAYNPGRADKLARLHVVSPIFAQRRVWLPESDRMPGKPRTWAEPMVAQLCAFTGEGSIKHDDYVDSCSQAFRLCMDKGFVKLVKPPKELPRVDEPLVNPYAA